MIDRGGKTLMPGFFDPHPHLVMQSATFATANLDSKPIVEAGSTAVLGPVLDAPTWRPESCWTVTMPQRAPMATPATHRAHSQARWVDAAEPVGQKRRGRVQDWCFAGARPRCSK